ncbi:MAG: hypothetical protein LC799_16900, partial [Actinobacteria bacterium]|nr:hypothetical protein [Actinomycetota bacterium]
RTVAKSSEQRRHAARDATRRAGVAAPRHSTNTGGVVILGLEEAEGFAASEMREPARSRASTAAAA